MMNLRILGLSLVALTLGLVSCGDDFFGSGSQEELRSQLKDQDPGDRWIYDDWDAALARAKAEKKPLFVSFRCVP